MKDVEELSRALLMTDPSILNSMLTTFPARKVKITAANELLWTLDGEAGGAHRWWRSKPSTTPIPSSTGNDPCGQPGRGLEFSPNLFPVS